MQKRDIFLGKKLLGLYVENLSFQVNVSLILIDLVTLFPSRLSSRVLQGVHGRLLRGPDQGRPRQQSDVPGRKVRFASTAKSGQIQNNQILKTFYQCY